MRRLTALDDLLPVLRCPHCEAALVREGEAVRCETGHSFDLARQGYLSLLGREGTAHTGDTAEMVAARERFLEGGHFDPLAAELVDAVAEAVEGGAVSPRGASAGAPACLLELGAGPGWYLSRVLDRLTAARGLALDVSKPALRRAARAHPRLAAVAADAWGPLPLRDRVVAGVVSVFAPRNGPEFARVLEQGGVAVIVTPAPGHLHELVAALGLIGMRERTPDELAPDLDVVETRRLEWRLTLERAAARDAAAMGPSAFHIDPTQLDERVAALPQPVGVTAAVSITLATA
jgi:23S rRNA (guanine745-N1)-methyltransferase